ncbi:hypothetical protein SAMD00019534_080650 [Acytostelium subglobosum LB1]|uniref:hypothetical protein n=1 Tax=Acytostelium subglobosum LB1 TaxID=1410327 RepID=UPI0006450AD4|nr:hypothetical protein SAMD00019534_080650 [Acytostelium subglobosum LB1]GAM24890.1 hypothetical protein SAMD00019534_080650 [Acytostelium subglobosum LB1]|eukprot:XP_012751979.1 hypothetical protein SAMD00019534_080650 [Acytostelium subglobosum LB1]
MLLSTTSIDRDNCSNSDCNNSNSNRDIVDEPYQPLVLVIDAGSGTTKAGFAGEDRPLAVFPTMVGRQYGYRCRTPYTFPTTTSPSTTSSQTTTPSQCTATSPPTVVNLPSAGTPSSNASSSSSSTSFSSTSSTAASDCGDIS